MQIHNLPPLEVKYLSQWLSALAGTGGLSYSYFNPAGVAGITFTNGATTTMYLAGHLSTSTLRLFSWAETSGTINYYSVGHVSYPTGSFSCPRTGVANSTSAPPASTVIPHSPTPLPTLVPPKNAQGVTVSMADDGRQIRIKPGQTILFALDDVLYDHWTIIISGPAILAAQSNAPLPPHTQALYKAVAPGQTTMLAKGDLKCAKATPPCQIFPQDIQIQVTVE